MRTTIGLGLLVILAFAPAKGVAQSAAPANVATHVGHIMTGFASAPNGAALLAVAEADAALAVEHSRLAGAGNDRTDTGPMVNHSRHVVRTLDASAVTISSPGSGMGVGPAARAIAEHAELAAQGAPEAVRTHAQHVAAAARAVAARSDQMLQIARRITPALDYQSAYDMVRQLQQLAAQLTSGVDANGDGQIAMGEGGLQHVRAHMELLGTVAGPE
jgi:hypothetical protein